MSEHIVAVFDTEKAADAAARDLENAGVSASAIRRFRPATMGAATDTSLGRTMESTIFDQRWLLGVAFGRRAKHRDDASPRSAG